MTLDALKTFDVPAAWARLTVEAQATIGTAVLAWQLASLVADDAVDIDDMAKAERLADDAKDGVVDAVEAAFPDIDWSGGAPSTDLIPQTPR